MKRVDGRFQKFENLRPVFQKLPLSVEKVFHRAEDLLSPFEHDAAKAREMMTQMLERAFQPLFDPEYEENEILDALFSSKKTLRPARNL